MNRTQQEFKKRDELIARENPTINKIKNKTLLATGNWWEPIKEISNGRPLNFTRTLICAYCNKTSGNHRVCDDCNYGGLRTIEGGRDFKREQVRMRDRWTCQNATCGRKWEQGQRRFDVHHLYGLCGKLSTTSRETAPLEDMITICHKCHIGSHEVVKKIKEGHKKLLTGRV